MHLSLVVIFPVFVAIAEASGDVLLVSLGPFPEERIQGLLATDVRKYDELAVFGNSFFDTGRSGPARP